EPDVGLDDEFRADRGQFVRENFEFLHGEYQPEMRDRYIVSVHRVRPGHPVAGGLRLPVTYLLGDDLVAAEVPIDPPGVGSTFGESENAAVDLAGSLDIVDGNGQVERDEVGLSGHGDTFLGV